MGDRGSWRCCMRTDQQKPIRVSDDLRGQRSGSTLKKISSTASAYKQGRALALPELELMVQGPPRASAAPALRKRSLAASTRAAHAAGPLQRKRPRSDRWTMVTPTTRLVTSRNRTTVRSSTAPRPTCADLRQNSTRHWADSATPPGAFPGSPRIRVSS